MKQAPYSLSEAQIICCEHQYLLGQPFSDDNDTPINSITIAPFDSLSKKRFIIYYLLFNDAEMACSHEYKGLLFDVMVIASTPIGDQLYHEDLHTWLSKNKLSANQPVTIGFTAPQPKAQRLL